MVGNYKAIIVYTKCLEWLLSWAKTHICSVLIWTKSVKFLVHILLIHAFFLMISETHEELIHCNQSGCIRSTLPVHFLCICILLQEAAVHKKLHPHASVCVFHTESCDCFHQGRGSVRSRRDRLPSICEYAVHRPFSLLLKALQDDFSIIELVARIDFPLCLTEVRHRCSAAAFPLWL